MRTQLTHGTAALALAAALAGTAHAQEQGAQEAFGPAYNDGIEVPASLLESFVVVDAPGRTDVDVVTPAAFAPAVSASIPAPNTANLVTLRSVEPSYQNVNALAGDVDASWRDINPFWGDIDAFWRDINPFYRDINAFWRDINPFYGDINPFYGDISAFWGDINPFYRDISAFDAQALAGHADFWREHSAQIAVVESHFAAISRNSAGEIIRDGTPNKMMDALAILISQGEDQFGAAYTAATGNSFDQLVKDVFARHGATPGNKASLENMTPSQRAAFFLDWHDTLNLYSGIDAVDHWMSAVNWTPAITQIQGSGERTIIGIIDGSFSTDTDLSNNIVWAGGASHEIGGHGAGVASLIAGAHDGHGTMGIAPSVSIATYNPFDAEGRSDWDLVAEGIRAFQPSGLGGANRFGKTSIINLSLGERGWVLSQGLADLFAQPDLARVNRDTLYVIAAGNEGVAQSADVNWQFNSGASTIFVGSVDTSGTISDFSNTPGSACLLDNGVCHAGNELFRRTVVAPGELLLVSDGHGGVVRRSGTSFAAPLVSGAVALLHDRWPWLTEHPEASAEIIFRSARDLGAPGPDEVYGWGLLDVQASQSPLDFNRMTFTLYRQNGSLWRGSGLSAVQVLAGGLPDWWETHNAFFTGVEEVGDTYRDFSIPVSSFTYGKRTNALGRGFERLQDFVSQRFSSWISSGGTDSDGDGHAGISELRGSQREVGGQWRVSQKAMAPRRGPQGELRLVHSGATFTDPSGKASFGFGFGQGAMALSNYQFGILSDHDPETGGVNPILGFASGDTFAHASYKLASNTKVSVGFTQNNDRVEDYAVDDPQAILRSQFGERPATAFTVGIEQRVNDAITLDANLTSMEEESSLLGNQSDSQALLGAGASTLAMTVSASINVGSGFSFDISGTGARTQTGRDQLFTNSGGVWSTAAQISATKRGLLSSRDTLRLSVAQPLQIEEGQLEFTSEQIVDRATGEIGLVTQTIGIETSRRIMGEAIYAMPLTGTSDFGVFGRYVSRGDFTETGGMVLGGNFSMRF